MASHISKKCHIRLFCTHKLTHKYISVNPDGRTDGRMDGWMDIRSKSQQTQATQNSNASKNELMAQARAQIMKELASAASK